MRHLSGAADHLAAGRDLLQTHLIPATAGAGPSPWAPVITSSPVTTALIAELARHAHRLAPWMSQLALARTPDSAVPAPACLAPHTASGWLWAAGSTMATAALPHPAATTSRRLLGAVPASTPPPRHRIGGTDTVAGLCAGAASTAERLRHACPWLPASCAGHRPRRRCPGAGTRWPQPSSATPANSSCGHWPAEPGTVKPTPPSPPGFERGSVFPCFVATPEFRIIRLHTRRRWDLT